MSNGEKQFSAALAALGTCESPRDTATDATTRAPSVTVTDAVTPPPPSSPRAPLTDAAAAVDSERTGENHSPPPPVAASQRQARPVIPRETGFSALCVLEDSYGNLGSVYRMAVEVTDSISHFDLLVIWHKSLGFSQYISSSIYGEWSLLNDDMMKEVLEVKGVKVVGALAPPLSSVELGTDNTGLDSRALEVNCQKCDDKVGSAGHSQPSYPFS